MSLAPTARDPHPAPPVDRAHGRGEGVTGRHILVVDPHDAARRALEELLRADGFATSAAPDGEAALAQVRRAMPDVVLTDLQMPRMDGAELCQRLHSTDPDLLVIVVAELSEMATVLASLRAGAEDYLVKPLEYPTLRFCLERNLARRAAKLEQERLYRTLTERLLLSSIREHEHAEAEELYLAQLNALLENLNEGVAIANPSGELLMINGAGRTILGVGDEAPRTVDTFHSLEARDLEGRPLSSERRPLHRALRGERFTDVEVLRTRPNGERRRLVSEGTCVRDTSGKVALAIVAFRDVTDLRRLEKQREEYLSLISHDLRSPLSSALICVSMLRLSLDKKGLTEDVNLAERAERSLTRMNAMLDELTESTSLESQGLALQRAKCDVRALIADVVGSMDEARARRITVETDEALQYVVLADSSRLERVVANLLGNALKYSSEDAPVTVRLMRDGTNVRFDVTDRGIGIAPESMKALFDRYYRTAAGQARARGLGLGLYIARLIVEAHGGRIEVFSEVGKGTTFSVVLPSRSVSM